MNQNIKRNLLEIIPAILGIFLYAVSYRIIIVPLHLFGGGFTGIAQTILAILNDFTGITLSSDFTGLLLLLLNIPLFYVVKNILSQAFLIKSIICILLQSLFMTIIPVPSSPIINDALTCTLVGGFLSGLGVGLTLYYGSCGGGTDILGLYLTSTHPGFSVGKLTLALNSCIYLFCAVHDNYQLAIYSIIFSFIASLIMDKIHYQNIMTCTFIVTKSLLVKDHIFETINRGCTIWKGFGGYRNEPIYIIMTVVSKEESNLLKKTVLHIDSQAFITFQDHSDIQGNFSKRFDRSA